MVAFFPPLNPEEVPASPPVPFQSSPLSWQCSHPLLTHCLISVVSTWKIGPVESPQGGICSRSSLLRATLQTWLPAINPPAPKSHICSLISTQGFFQLPFHRVGGKPAPVSSRPVRSDPFSLASASLSPTQHSPGTCWPCCILSVKRSPAFQILSTLLPVICDSLLEA